MLKTAINPANLQAHLESATNAAAKGQAQYHTPVEWGAILASPLPRYRPVVVDLTCGAGHLLTAASGPSTLDTLGCDIEAEARPADEETPSRITSFAHADVTKFYPLLRAVKFKADLFALNPPWDLHWHRCEPHGPNEGAGRLADLANSDCQAVRMAFAAHDGRTSAGTIDSTVATFCLALDLSSPYGEGFIVANEATLQRQIFAPNAPHRLLAAHVWAHLVIEGNICQAGPNNGRGDSPFQTGVIYFARGHTTGCEFTRHIQAEQSMLFAKRAGSDLAENRLQFRRGAVIKPIAYTKDSAALWDGAEQEFAALNSQLSTSDYNLWLDHSGVIRTNLSVFDTASGRVDKSEAARLFALNGRNPMQLVVQRNHRKELERAAFGDGGSGGSPWRVEPALQAAVKKAVLEYDAVRAPIVPLSKIQRLGYLDELDEIVSCKDLRTPNSEFRTGKSYAIRTLTIQTVRTGDKLNLEGGLDDVEWSGSELAIYLTDDGGVERLFMESKLRVDQVQLSIAGPVGKNLTGRAAIAFTLQQLAGHFIIPEVPDVATLFPEKYQHNLDLLDEIERLVNA